jgi:hypothetical protein
MIPVLLTGLRVHFFTFWLTFLLFYKIKFNKKFTVKELIYALFLTALLSVFSELFRNNSEIYFLENPLIYFIRSQGYTFNVIALSIDNYSKIESNTFSYFINQIISIFPNIQYGDVNSLGDDLTLIINSQAFFSGYNIGTSYIAESFLALGIFGVIFSSYFLGIIANLITFENRFKSKYYFIFAFTFVQCAIFMPREGLFSSFSSLIKVLIYCLLLKIILLIFYFTAKVLAPNYKKY